MIDYIQATYRKLRKQWKRSRGVHTLLAPVAVLDDGVFLTRRGDIFTVMSVRGVDAECLDKASIEVICRRLEAALRILDEDYHVLQYVSKRSSPFVRRTVIGDSLEIGRSSWLHDRAESLYSLSLHLVVLRTRPLESKLQSVNLWSQFSRRDMLRISRSALRRDMAYLETAVDSLTTQLADLVGPVRLGTRDAVGFLRSLTNLTPVKANVWGEVPSAFLDQYLGGSSLECWPHELRQDRYAIRLLSLTDPPLSTFAHILQGLLPVQSEYIVCSEWSRIRNEKARSVIKRKMSNFNFLKTKITSEAMASNQQQVVVNQDAKKIVKQMNDAVAEMELNSSHFGRFALTIAVFDEDEHRLRYSLAKMYEVFSRHDATVVEESLNALNAWAAMMPGNYAYSLRNLMLLNTNYADMAVCLFSPSKGEEYNAHLKDTALALLETREATLYNLNLHYQDVGHTLLVGSIGSGKSFLLNFLVLSFQKYQPYTTIFDLGGSYKALTAHRGGSYLHLGNAASTITINPFTLPLDAANLDFLVAFVQLLIEAGSYSMTPDHLKDLAKQIKRLYRLEPEVRRLSTLALMCKREYSRRLDQFVNEGRFASYFDNELDTLTVAPFQTFDFEGIDNNSPILEPLLFYVLHRASARIHDPLEARRPKLFALDEAWRFFGHATTRAYIHEALKTWRKRNATVVLATQSYDDLVRSELRDTILESCMTTMFLANPGMDAAAYKEAFAMNSAEAKLVAELIPKRQFLVRQPSGSKILNLDVDDESYRVYANKPREAKEAHA